MRVALLVDRFPLPSEHFIVEEALGLIDDGHDVTVFATPISEALDPSSDVVRRGLANRCRFHGSLFSGLLARGTAFGQSPLPELRRLRRRVAWKALRYASPHDTVKRLFDVLEEAPFDVVHAHFGHFARRLVALREAGYPAVFVTSFHGYDATVAPATLGPNGYRHLFGVGDAFLANSGFLKERLLRLGARPEKLTLAPVPVSTEQVHFAERHLAPGETVQLLTVSRLVEVKGLESAILALAQLHARGVSFHYRIAGEGELRPRLERMIAEHRLRDHVELLGAVPHRIVRDLYARSHLFLLPSVRARRGDEEAQGVVVQEAQAAGLPVVVSDSGGIREGIVPEKSGLVFRAGDPKDLADAIVRLVENSERWPAMGRAGRELVLAHFSARTHTRRLVQCYLEAIEKAGAAKGR